jgi:hypothetical protein
MATASWYLHPPTAPLQTQLWSGNSTTMVRPLLLPDAPRLVTPGLPKQRPMPLLLVIASLSCATTSTLSSSIRVVSPWVRCVTCTVKRSSRVGLRQSLRWMMLATSILIRSVMALRAQMRSVVVVPITESIRSRLWESYQAVWVDD